MPNGNYKKSILSKTIGDLIEKPVFRAEAAARNVTPSELLDNYMSVEFLGFLSNDDYGQMLAESVVFLRLYDATANNAILESIARCTPVLVNRLRATEEYLGRGYPLFYDSFEEASHKASDEALLIEAHEYLKDGLDRERFYVDRFADDIKSFVRQME